MAKEYALLFGYAGDVIQKLYSPKEVSDFIIKYGTRKNVRIVNPDGACIIETYGIYPDEIYDNEYGREVLSYLMPRIREMQPEFDDSAERSV